MTTCAGTFDSQVYGEIVSITRDKHTALQRTFDIATGVAFRQRNDTGRPESAFFFCFLDEHGSIVYCCVARE